MDLLLNHVVFLVSFRKFCFFYGKPPGSTQGEPGTGWISGTIGALWIGGRHAVEVGRYII